MKKNSVIILAVLIILLVSLVSVTVYFVFTGFEKMASSIMEDLSPEYGGIFQEAEIESGEYQTSGVIVSDVIDYSQVDLILIEVKSEDGKTEREHFQFSLRPPVKGSHKIMVPVINRAPVNDLLAFGIDVNVTVEGRSCTLTKGDDSIVFDIESITCFKNNEPFQFLTDMPFYNNGALYIPFETVLDAFDIEYRYEENKLIVEIGG